MSSSLCVRSTSSFEQGWPRRTEKNPSILVGGVTVHNRNQQKMKNYSQVLERKLEDAIGSSSFHTSMELRNIIYRTINRDVTTWDKVAGARYTRADGPPS
jgi:hypothetical protein